MRVAVLEFSTESYNSCVSLASQVCWVVICNALSVADISCSQESLS